MHADLSDLGDKLEWARTHDDEARAMVIAARELTRTHLSKDAINCYILRLIMHHVHLVDEGVRLQRIQDGEN